MSECRLANPAIPTSPALHLDLETKRKQSTDFIRMSTLPQIVYHFDDQFPYYLALPTLNRTAARHLSAALLCAKQSLFFPFAYTTVSICSLPVKDRNLIVSTLESNVQCI